eukprot:89200-Rhodomonas_salina.2
MERSFCLVLSWPWHYAPAMPTAVLSARMLVPGSDGQVRHRHAPGPAPLGAIHPEIKYKKTHACVCETDLAVLSETDLALALRSLRCGGSTSVVPVTRSSDPRVKYKPAPKIPIRQPPALIADPEQPPPKSSRGQIPAILLRACYAMSGTELGFRSRAMSLLCDVRY